MVGASRPCRKPSAVTYSRSLLTVILFLTAITSAIAQPTPTSNPPRKKVPSGIDVGSVVAEEQSRIRNRQPKGDPVSLSLFGGKPVTGRSFVFLIDRSKSMSLGALAAAEKQLVSAIAKLQPNHQFQVIAYSNECTYLRERKMLAGTDENKTAVIGFVSGLTAIGTTEHERGILSGLHHGPDVLFLLTDGGVPELSDNQILRLTKLAGNRTAIHCIQFSSGPFQEPQKFLQYLAHQNRGTFAVVP